MIIYRSARKIQKQRSAFADEYPDARVVEIALTFEDGSKLTFSQDERILEAMEAHRHEYD